MVHCLITDKENYCALRPQSYELHTVEGVFYPLLYKLFIEAYCVLRSPSYGLHTVEGVFLSLIV